ncbi:MAG TPA: type VI secretion system contractile sheath large subunit, partial [Marinagarivorans sp.]|nr:type VI secretion system contractile sheath large subunit [Marinagarivorans sp.]
SAQTDVEQLIRSIVAPYATLKADIRLSEVQNAINQAMAQTLRSILHHGHFHNLEATWRSLYFFVRRIASDNGIKIWLLDISEAELAQASQEEPTQSALYDLLVKQRQAAGQSAHNLIINLFAADSNLTSLNWLKTLAAIAAANNGACVGAANPNIAGCSNLIGMPDPSQWQGPPEDFATAWQSFRASADAAHLALTAPRFLLRTPYGKKSSPIETFDFTEMITEGNHQHYLWGNSGVLVGVVLAELWLNGKGVINSAAASQIDQLPIHVEKTAAGEQLIPSAEIVILDSTVAALRAAGLLVVRSIYNKNAVLIPLLNSCAADGALLYSR